MYSFFTVLIALMVFNYANAAGCGKQASGYEPYLKAVRVANGQTARPHSWPWMITQRVNGNIWCGGTLLRVRENVEYSDIVLTAGHCLYYRGNGFVKDLVQNWTVLAGMHHKSDTQYVQTSYVIDQRWPPEYLAAATGHDMALLKLREPIQFNAWVLPICLPEYGAAKPVGKQCFAAGWGANSTHGTTDYLQQLESPVHAADYCGLGNALSEVKLCSGPLYSVTATCSGDSGGPLMCRESDGRWVQYGVVSTGVGACGRKKLTAYSRVSLQRYWIDKTINELTSIGKSG